MKIPDGGKVATLQRLLVEAGTDPGPVDGFIGPATLNALASIWKSPDTALDLDKAANALREIICENAG